MTDAEKRAKMEAFGKKYGVGEQNHDRAPEKKPAPPRPAPPGAERTRPNRDENEFMLNLMIVRNALAKYSPALRERARRAGRYTWRDIRLMFRLVDKVQLQLTNTMPDRRNEYYAAYAQGGHYELVMNGPVRNPRLVLIQDKHLAALTEAAMEAECPMCFREGSEIGKCALRAALLEVAVPREIEDGLWRKCEYRDAASQLINNKEVTI